MKTGLLEVSCSTSNDNLDIDLAGVASLHPFSPINKLLKYTHART